MLKQMNKSLSHFDASAKITNNDSKEKLRVHTFYCKVHEINFLNK